MKPSKASFYVGNSTLENRMDKIWKQLAHVSFLCKCGYPLHHEKNRLQALYEKLAGGRPELYVIRGRKYRRFN